MPGIQDLIAATQGGGQSTPTPGGGNDIIAQLQALLGGGFKPNMGAPGVPGQANMGAYLNANKPGPNDPMINAMAKAQAGDPRMEAVQGGGNVKNMGTVGVDPSVGTGTDMDLVNVAKANQSVRGDLPVKPTMDMSGYGDEFAPMNERRQTPNPDGKYPDEEYKIPGQGKKDMSTEDELDMINKKMGADGSKPDPEHLKALANGDMEDEEFDAIYGPGMANAWGPYADPGNKNPNPDKDNDPTTRKIPLLDKKDDGDHEYR